MKRGSINVIELLSSEKNMIFIGSDMPIKIECSFGDIERVFQNTLPIFKQHIIDNTFA